MPTSRKKLPAGFRHLFSLKEIRHIEQLIGVRFQQISFGHLLNTATYQSEQAIQSAFYPVTVNGYLKEGIWLLRIHQSGFRQELLPNQQAIDTKNSVIKVLSAYALKLINSQETDFLYRPQLRVEVTISHNQVAVRSLESR